MVESSNEVKVIKKMIKLSTAQVGYLTVGGEEVTKQGMNDYSVGITEHLSFDQAVKKIVGLVNQGYKLKEGR